MEDYSNRKIRTIFMGTPDFAVPGFRAILTSPSFEVVGVFTQSDKPVGRNQVVTAPPVKTLAVKNNVPVFQPLKLKTEAGTIQELKPDLIVVIAYGKIISDEILAIPPLGCINVHASLLPKYRGAACLNAPILNGDSETGVTIMKIDSGLDTGPILRQAEIKLSGKENLPELHDRLSSLGAELLIPTIEDYLAGKIKPVAQDDSKASYIKTLKKEDGKIDWNKSAREIERQIRAFNPWPGTFGLVGEDKKMVKILSVNNEIIALNGRPAGEIFQDSKRLIVQCGQDCLHVLKLQLAGGKALTAQEFLSGHVDLVGQIIK